MRSTACTLVFLTLVPLALPAQRLELAPTRLALAEPAPDGGW
jgi:hypothetical protein